MNDYRVLEVKTDSGIMYQIEYPKRVVRKGRLSNTMDTVYVMDVSLGTYTTEKAAIAQIERMRGRPLFIQ